VSVAVRSHPIRWVTPAPLWQAILGPARAAPDDATRATMRRPALLRFHSDRFMDDLQALLGADSAGLAAHVAKPESFRVRPPGAAAGWQPAGLELKLFQPIHGDFNLVAASLACARPGLPEHDVRAAERERVSFVLRREESGVEYAWLKDDRRWLALGNPRTVPGGEDLLPLAPLPFTDVDGRLRHVHVGLVPTASLDTFRNEGALALTPKAGERTTPAPDPRAETLRVRLIEPFAELRKAPASNSAVQDAQRLLMLDVADFLREHVPTTWAQVEAGAPGKWQGPTLYDRLWCNNASVGLSWATALRQAWAQRLRIAGEESGSVTLTLDLSQSQVTPSMLSDWVSQAWPVTAPAPSTSPSESGEADLNAGATTAALPKLAGRDPRFVVRCVYQRPECEPLHPDLVSPPSDAFRIGGFFDLDAPARRINITMPIDTSVKDLRKFKKNVSIALSDQLRQQVSRIGEAEDVIKKQLKAGEPLDIGMVCSFSIPIITICALFVLMIFLVLLNIVFWWLPFFRICFPIVMKARR
jgi:hypothetical protein